MARPLDTNRIVAEILAGQHTDQLSDIYQAVLKIVATDEMRVRWRLPYEDLDITEDNFTVGECITVEQETGMSWAAITPGRTAQITASILIAALKGRKGMDDDEARSTVYAIPGAKLAEMIENYVEEASPLDQTATSEATGPFE